MDPLKRTSLIFARLGRALCALRVESGQSLLLFVFALTTLIGFAAMTIDVGQYMYERRSRQNAADAAALAGAAQLPSNPDSAITQARDYVLKNGFEDSDIESITVSTENATNDTVTVKLDSPFSWGFARVLGLFQTNVGADAAARVGSPASTAALAPWSVLESAIDWSGGPTVLKYDANNPQTGNFGSIRIDGTGASTYTTTIQNGSTNSLCAQSQPSCTNPTATTQTGNMVGPTRTGVNYITAYTTNACDTFDEAFNQRPDGTYTIEGICNPWTGATDSKRIIMVPVIGSLCNGSCNVTILYFAVFFLETLGSCNGNSCEVTGQFARVVADPTNGEFGTVDSHNALRYFRLIS